MKGEVMTYEMEIKKIENVLAYWNGSESDRMYWVKRLDELRQKRKTANENEKYFKVMRRYDR